MVNFFLWEIFRGNLNEVIPLAEIALFRFPRKTFLKRKSTFRDCKTISLMISGEIEVN